jgi:hypothetical protein
MPDITSGVPLVSFHTTRGAARASCLPPIEGVWGRKVLFLLNIHKSLYAGHCFLKKKSYLCTRKSVLRWLESYQYPERERLSLQLRRSERFFLSGFVCAGLRGA